MRACLVLIIASVIARSSGSGGGCDAAPCTGDASNLLQLVGNVHLPYPNKEDPQLASERLIDDLQSTCHTVFLATVFSSRNNPVHGGRVKPTVSYFEKYMRSILTIPGGRVKAVVLHDSIPDNVTSPLTMADGSFSFVRLDTLRFPKWFILVDMRYAMIEEQVKQPPEPITVCMSGVRDVVFFHNPCERQPDNVFVHSQEQQALMGARYVAGQFKTLGGQYCE
mmetsp:Transcript_81308/g.225921  ORF Transcript_81308/g.225921 Transcript_81308/m.225921 type:complete len:223 (+) Transcript_81308:53-721(+)